MDSRRHCGSRTLYASSICWRSRFALSTLPSILAVLALAYWIVMLSASDYLWTCLTSASLNSWWWSTRPDHLSNIWYWPHPWKTMETICSFLENPIPPWSQSVLFEFSPRITPTAITTPLEAFWRLVSPPPGPEPLTLLMAQKKELKSTLGACVYTSLYTVIQLLYITFSHKFMEHINIS